MELITADVERVAATQVAIIEQVALIVVTNDEQADSANDVLKNMRAAAKKLEEDRVSLKAPSLEACRRVDGFFNGKIQLLTDSAAVLKAKIAGYLDDKEQKRKAEEARLKAIADAERKRLEDEARKKDEAAAAARAKAAQEAENARKASEEAERKRAAAEAEGNAKAAAKAAEESARQAEKAKSAIAAGEAKATGLETTAVQTRDVAATVSSAASVPTAGAKPKGFSSRKVWSCEVVNLKALVEAVAAGKQPIHLLLPNESALNGIARAAKAQFAVEGCVVKSRTA